MPKETRPMTPTSPIATSTHTEDPSFPTPERATSVSSIDITSHNPSTSPGPEPNNTSSVPLVPNRQARLTRQRLVLVLEDANGSLDDDNPLPATHLGDSNVTGFFALVSEISKKPLESLDCLTFTFIFAPGNERVVEKGDEKEWNKLKKKALLLFKLYRTRSDESEFQLVVEIGDKKKIVTGLDAMWCA